MRKNYIFCILTFHFFCVFNTSLFAVRIVPDKEIFFPFPFTPSVLCVDEFNHLYILDNKSQKVIKMSESGDIIDTLIRGKGRGIKEAERLFDIAYGDGKIVVCDIALQRISIFDTTGKFVNSFLTSLTSREQLSSSIRTNGNIILIRRLKEKESDSMTFSGWLLQKYNTKGDLSDSLIYKKLSEEVWAFAGLPFEVSWDKQRLFVLIPFANLEIFDFKGKSIKKVRRDRWLYTENIKLLDKKYLLITSCSSGEIDTALPDEIIDIWGNIMIDKTMRNTLKEKGLALGKNRFSEGINYILDIYDIKKDKFVLTDYILPGRLLGTYKNYIFFRKGKNIVKVKVE